MLRVATGISSVDHCCRQSWRSIRIVDLGRGHMSAGTPLLNMEAWLSCPLHTVDSSPSVGPVSAGTPMSNKPGCCAHSGFISVGSFAPHFERSACTKVIGPRAEVEQLGLRWYFPCMGNSGLISCPRRWIATLPGFRECPAWGLRRPRGDEFRDQGAGHNFNK